MNLSSEDNPLLSEIVASRLEFAEHESSIITASINEPTARNVVVQLTFDGTATNELDYTVNYETKGDEFLLQSLDSNIRDFEYLDDGRLLTLVDYDNINIYALDGTMTSVSLRENDEYHGGGSIVKDGINIYFIAHQRVSVLNTISMEFTADVIPNLENTDESYLEIMDVVDGKVFYIRRDGGGVFNVQSKLSGEDPVLLSQGNGYPVDGFEGIVADADENIYFQRDDGIYIINDEGNFVRSPVLDSYPGYFQLRKLQFLNNSLYGKIINYSNGENQILRFEANLEGFTVVDFEMGEEVSSITDFTFTSSGQLALLNSLNGGSYQINGYKSVPEITILAGEVTGSLEVIGMEDDLNSPGEEENESIVLGFLDPINASLADGDELSDIELTLLNNELSLNEDLDALVNVPALSSSAVAWGDYDSDGDQDLAIMGIGVQDGIVTRLYENVDGVFVDSNQPNLDPRYEGDLIWSDYDKDGSIDLIVSGLDTSDLPATTVYRNVDGILVPNSDLVLPDLFGSSLDSGDLDNDGDIDFVINGMAIVDGVNVWKKYIYLREGESLVQEQDFNNQFGQEGVRNGTIKIADNEFDGDLDIFMIGESNSKIQNNTFIKPEVQNNWWWNNGYITDMDNSSAAFFGNYIYYMGQTNQSNDALKVYKRSLLSGQEDEMGIAGLINGSIALGDYNNDGAVDMVLTGENENAESVTKLYDGIATINPGYDPMSYSGFVENSEIPLIGLRNSTAEWVDYDGDGDLDLFLTGTSDSGEYTKLYRTDLLNKNNTPADAISGLVFEDLGYGKVRLSWDVPTDDFSDNLGYILRLGTTEGGSEITNTESNLSTGQRLITKSAVIYQNSFETLLDPGNYYWSVQSVDDGLKGSVFSEENAFVLTYEWKELNQGGIIDRNINAVSSPVVKLSDIDLDNDMDLIYGSSENDNDIQVFTLGAKKFMFYDMISNSRNVSDIKFLDFNTDDIQDIIINTWDGTGNSFLKLYNSVPGSVHQEVFSAPGLYQSKIEFIDINNDGIKEIIHIGRTNAEANSQLKVLLYEQEGETISATPLDMSDQFDALKSGSYGFGNIDKDGDIDFGITGLSNTGITSKIYYNDTQIVDSSVVPLFTPSEIEFPEATDSTLDFFDFDGDGDLDIAITGQGVSGPIFKILANNGEAGGVLAFTEVPDTGLIPIREAKLDFGDYNSDGYTDILYSGKVSGEGEVTKLVEFDPLTQTYVDSNFDLSDITNASIAFGDLDGDFDLDFTIAGESASSSQNIIRTYLNVRDVSAAVIESNSLLDVDENKNSEEVFAVNERPDSPINLETEILEFDGDSNTYKIQFTWDLAQDDTTPQAGMTYALKIGTTEGAEDVMSVNALSNGYRLFAGKGNVEHQNEWVVNLPDLPEDGAYYWTVQSIDASYSGSEFATFTTVDPYERLLGDSNGDLTVDVLDIVQDVDYILGNNPSPFVYESADVNNDQEINVLDLVGTVDIILNPSDLMENEDSENKTSDSNDFDYYSSASVGDAEFDWEGNDLYVTSAFDIGGIQLAFDVDFEYVISQDIVDIETLDFTVDETRVVMLYSFNNTTIASSRTKILTRVNASQNLNINEVVVGTTEGTKLNPILKSADELADDSSFDSLKIYPNPVQDMVNIQLTTLEEVDRVSAEIYDIQGRLVFSKELEYSFGQTQTRLNLARLQTGNYIIKISAFNENLLIHQSTKVLILK